MNKKKTFKRTVTLFDDDSTRKKNKIMDKWDVILDDERNPDFEGLDDFLEFGKTYSVVIKTRYS